MESSSAPKITANELHQFTSADNTVYYWGPRAEAAITLDQSEIEDLRRHILGLPDEVIQNQESGNGIPMGVKIPLSGETLDKFLALILTIIKFKEKLPIHISEHAMLRLTDDMVTGPGHPDFRGWLSESDVDACVKTICQVDGARLTIDRRTLASAAIFFRSELALEIRGTKPDGTQGTLALAIVGSSSIRIITLL